MSWKTVAKLAKVIAYAVVPGAAGYVAYKHIVRPWLDGRAAKGKRATLPVRESEPLEALPAGREKPPGS
jgi:hypothetical protein